MKCPICGTSLPPGAERCPDCGYRCPTAQAQSPQIRATGSAAPYTPPNKTKTSRGCCCALILVIPVVILLAALLFAAANRISEDFSVEAFEDFYGDSPPAELIPESLPAVADEGCFTAADNTLMFLPDSWDGSPILRVPEYIGEEHITTIGPGCFAGCADLTTILLPKSVTVISPMAFSGCARLRGLFLPDGVEAIGSNAFSGCVDLEAVHIPASVTDIAPGCFDDCASLVYIFYGGTYEDWEALYSDYINPFTIAICLDGDYYHGAVG